MRHTAVALAVAAGAHPKTIQQRMGHSSITLTLDRYGHLFPGVDDALASALDSLHYAAPNSGQRHASISDLASSPRVTWSTHGLPPRPPLAERRPSEAETALSPGLSVGGR